jgi:hypothetical protein
MGDLPTRLDRTIVRGNDVSFGFTWTKDTNSVTDGVTADGDTHVHSATAQWVSGNIGDPIYGDNIPFGTTIASVVSPSEVVMSLSAIEDGTGLTFLWGTTVDVSGWVFASEVRGRADYPDVLAAFTVDGSQGAAGLTTLALPRAQTLALPTGPLAWDIAATISGLRVTLMAGTLTVEDGVTL